MTCAHDVNVGAYVIGALAPAERAGFERHLVDCPSCRASIHELAALPGLLGRLSLRDVAGPVPDGEPAGDDPGTLQVWHRAGDASRLAPDGYAAGPATAGPATPGAGAIPATPVIAGAGAVPVTPGADPGGRDGTVPPTVLTGLLARARRRDRRRRLLSVGVAGGFAAACVALLIVLVGVLPGSDPGRPPARPPQALVSMRPVPGAGAVPVTAEISLRSFTGGTRVEMHCHYFGAPPTGTSGYGPEPGGAVQADGRQLLRLYVMGADGGAEEVASWTAASGTDVQAFGTSHLAPGAISRVELRADGGAVLLTYTP